MAQRIDAFSRAVPRAAQPVGRTAIFTKAQSDTLYLLSKRIFDFLLSLALLVILSPLFLGIALAIFLDSPGPVVFVQRRVGKGGRVFSFFKFRSMYRDTDPREHQEFAREYINGNHQKLGNGSAPLYKPAAHITRVGRFLRRTSLDELPQLFNILKGDMSFVGPRPSIDYELQEYKPWHRRRLEVLPGLTGWAQIHGRSTLTFDEIASLDIEYIERRSFWFDLWIILRTIPVWLSCKGAG